MSSVSTCSNSVRDRGRRRSGSVRTYINSWPLKPTIRPLRHSRSVTLGTNVEVLRGDARHLAFASDTFDSVASFTMLHHVPTFQDQQLLLSEAFRVLKPGGTFLGSDSLSSNGLHHFHEGDDYNPVDPASFLTRLQAVGFTKLTIVVDENLKFAARKPDLNVSTESQHNEKE